MPLKTLFIYYWPLLSIAIVAVLFRLIHNARATVRALEIQMPDTSNSRGERQEANAGQTA